VRGFVEELGSFSTPALLGSQGRPSGAEDVAPTLGTSRPGSVLVMQMVCHHLDSNLKADVAFAESRIPCRDDRCEDILHRHGSHQHDVIGLASHGAHRRGTCGRADAMPEPQLSSLCIPPGGLPWLLVAAPGGPIPVPACVASMIPARGR